MMISAQHASLLSATVATSVVLVVTIVAAIVSAEVLAESGIGIAVVKLLATGLVAFGLVAVSVRLGLRMSRSRETWMWIAIAVPLVSLAIFWFLPVIPLEELGDKAFAMFAVSHPTALASTILLLVALVEAACVLIAVSFAFGQLARRLPVPPNTSLERTRER